VAKVERKEIIIHKGLVIDSDGALERIQSYVDARGNGMKVSVLLDERKWPAIRMPGVTMFTSQFLANLANIVVTDEADGTTCGFTEITFDLIDGKQYFTAHFKLGVDAGQVRQEFRSKFFINLTDLPHVELPSTVLYGDPTKGDWTLPAKMEAWLTENLGSQAHHPDFVNQARRWNWAIAEVYPVSPQKLTDRFVASFVFYDNIDADLFTKTFGMVEA
jgi:hypothetical protein